MAFQEVDDEDRAAAGGFAGAAAWLYAVGMRDIDLFQLALGLTSPWTVQRSTFDPQAKRVDIHIDFPRGSRFACPRCGKADRPVHDTVADTWRHLNFFEHRAYLHARVPRTGCDDCGVLKVGVPWARPGSGFTLLLEGVILSMVEAMPVMNVARIVGEQDTRIWRVLRHYVDKAVETQDLSAATQIAIDETSAKRGHDYITLFADIGRRRVVYVADGKSSATVTEFGDWLERHGGRRENIVDVSIDMSAAFVSGVRATFPRARITFDRFHVMKLVGEAVDEVRRKESRRDAALKGTRYIWLKNVDKLTQAQAEQLAALEGSNLDTLQAYQIRMNLQQLFRMGSVASTRKFLARWLTWVEISGLAPMIKAARTIREKSKDILRAIETGLSNGFMEAINSRVQAAKRMARGYRTKRNLKAITYLVAGDIAHALPT